MRRNEGGGSGSSGVRVRAVFAPGGACYIGIVFFFFALSRLAELSGFGTYSASKNAAIEAAVFTAFLCFEYDSIIDFFRLRLGRPRGVEYITGARRLASNCRYFS